MFLFRKRKLIETNNNITWFPYPSTRHLVPIQARPQHRLWCKACFEKQIVLETRRLGTNQIEAGMIFFPKFEIYIKENYIITQWKMRGKITAWKDNVKHLFKVDTTHLEISRIDLSAECICFFSHKFYIGHLDKYPLPVCGPGMDKIDLSRT